MGAKSNIEWTDDTDNIIVVKGGGWWCRKISAGCDHCYAARLNMSTYFGGNKLAYGGKPPELELRREMMAGWARQTRGRRHFVASMTDVFGEWVPREWAFEMLDAMTAAPRQTFQVLTKRPEIAREYICAWVRQRGRERLPDNIWIGATIENAGALERHFYLMTTPAAVRFWSVEPMLSAIDVHARGHWRDFGAPEWVICGGESGPGARPMHPEWVRSMRDQCLAHSVPFFFKQWGEWIPESDDLDDKDFPDGTRLPDNWRQRPNHFCCLSTNGERKSGYCGVGEIFFKRLGKHAAGRLLDGREWSEFPNVGGCTE